MNKRIHDNDQQFKDYTVVSNTQTSRNLLLKNIIERSEKNFMILLTNLFPGKKTEIRKYIKMAGYSDQEIHQFIDRTLKKDWRPNCLIEHLALETKINPELVSNYLP